MYNLSYRKNSFVVFWDFSLFRNNLLDAVRVIQIKSSLCRNWFETTNTYRGVHIRQNLKAFTNINIPFQIGILNLPKSTKKVFVQKKIQQNEWRNRINSSKVILKWYRFSDTLM